MYNMWKKVALIIITIAFVACSWMIYDGMYKPSKMVQNNAERIIERSAKTLEEEVFTDENINKVNQKRKSLVEAWKAGRKKYKEVEDNKEAKKTDIPVFEDGSFE